VRLVQLSAFPILGGLRSLLVEGDFSRLLRKLVLLLECGSSWWFSCWFSGLCAALPPVPPWPRSCAALPFFCCKPRATTASLRGAPCCVPFCPHHHRLWCLLSLPVYHSVVFFCRFTLFHLVPPCFTLFRSVPYHAVGYPGGAPPTPRFEAGGPLP